MPSFLHDHLLPHLRALSPELRRVEDPAAMNTERITSAIEEAAARAGARSEREVYAGRLPNGERRRGQTGWLDVVVRSGDGETFAIEVDRENKLWSATKLRHVRDTVGWTPVWVRWREKIRHELPRDIHLIDMCHWEVRLYEPETE